MLGSLEVQEPTSSTRGCWKFKLFLNKAPLILMLSPPRGIPLPRLKFAGVPIGLGGRPPAPADRDPKHKEPVNHGF